MLSDEAKQALGLPKPTPDGASRQDRAMSKMSLEQIRAFRQDAMKKAMSTGLVSRTHNKAQENLAAAIHEGERLTGNALKKLIKQAKSQAGISAGELIAFTLGKTKKNVAIGQDAENPTMSPELLRYYVANVQLAAERFAGGISPIDVVNQSRDIDIKRANEQIFMANVFKRKGGELYFLTNAGPDSTDINHKVVVELLDYQQFLLGRTTMPKRHEMVELLKHGKIKFDCDCGRHQYWYRYLATIGRYNHGVSENRYPSTRNPQLTGVACKHALRVMNVLMSGYGVAKLQGYIKQDLAKIKGKGLIDHKSQRTELHHLKKEAALQTTDKKAEHWRRKIKKELKEAATQIKEIKRLMTADEFAKILEVGGVQLSAKQLKALQEYESNRSKKRE
ncbi:MAG: hypothetical protein Q4B81_00210 [Moraxella sp.]|nr:hypothetical protein [Moraxella sp.]